ncbi:MAG: prepilin-type N-terminal cleavage/methylation domain-containing protein [Methylacidiphilales bacterium]|nr:prepilin-type N-terminal cleavage/methylation domain-containing protein [Candidatus Methylacidiphilales bacterium]
MSPSFTLVEMLVVLGIIGIIAAIAVPLIPSLLKANVVNQNVATLSGILEQARETAISGNTYVWVAFYNPPATSPRSGTWVATFDSVDGTDPISPNQNGWSNTLTVPGPIGSTSLQLVSKLQNLSGAQITNSGALPDGLTTLATNAGITNPASPFQPTPTTPTAWTVTPLQNTDGYSSTSPYTIYVIEFTPDGEAHTQPVTPGQWYGDIAFGMVPSVGASTNDDVLMNLSRLTGRVTVFRP